LEKKLSADLHLLSACTFIALQTQQIGVVRQAVSQISFQQFVKLDEFIVNVCFLPDRLHRPSPVASLGCYTVSAEGGNFH